MRNVIFGLIALVVPTAVPASAHHSFAMYDQTVTKTLCGQAHALRARRQPRTDPVRRRRQRRQRRR